MLIKLVRNTHKHTNMHRHTDTDTHKHTHIHTYTHSHTPDYAGDEPHDANEDDEALGVGEPHYIYCLHLLLICVVMV